MQEEALIFLNSEEGKDWVAACAYEHAQDVLGGREESTALKWRQRLANGRKRRVIRRYERKKRSVTRIRDKRRARMVDEVARLKEKLELPENQVEGAFTRVLIESKLEDLTNRMNNMVRAAGTPTVTACFFCLFLTEFVCPCYAMVWCVWCGVVWCVWCAGGGRAAAAAATVLREGVRRDRRRRLRAGPSCVLPRPALPRPA